MGDPKKENSTFCADCGHEGREKAFMDVDRMINEGMSGGYVSRYETDPNIPEAMDLIEEEPPADYSHLK
ncbi:hypothetical protein [Peribacillus alkalitolerans]|uniref:hypothetical protein n=1 Tax=Peribacillus alkalitolerans TaxID=1550385 RepID=UPI0013CF9534|nr:hypothetical protein [Peribacillus alkalitolerans]